MKEKEFVTELEKTDNRRNSVLILVMVFCVFGNVELCFMYRRKAQIIKTLTLFRIVPK